MSFSLSSFLRQVIKLVRLMHNDLFHHRRDDARELDHDNSRFSFPAVAERETLLAVNRKIKKEGKK